VKRGVAARIQLFAAVLLLASACSGLRISRYYWGANLHSDGGALVRPVPERVDEVLQPFSRSCARAIVRGVVDQLRSVAAGDLGRGVASAALLDFTRGGSGRSI
jgi:hypothetical protein